MEDQLQRDQIVDVAGLLKLPDCSLDDWRKLADALSASDKVEFVMPSSIRFAGEAGDHVFQRSVRQSD